MFKQTLDPDIRKHSLMLSPTRTHPELSAWAAIAVFSGMLTTLAALAHLTPAVVARSTTLFSAIGWAGGWGIAVVVVTLLSWVIARKTGVGVRDGYGIVPRWSLSPRRLVQIDYGLEAAIVGALALGVYLVVDGVVLATSESPLLEGPLLVVLLTQVITAALCELVLLGVLAALMKTSRLTSWVFLLVSAAGRVVIVEPGWPGLFTAVVGGTVVGVLYLRTRRLTPIIVGHALATIAITLAGVWIVSLI